MRKASVLPQVQGEIAKRPLQPNADAVGFVLAGFARAPMTEKERGRFDRSKRPKSREETPKEGGE
jgi:hypothetical protein